MMTDLIKVNDTGYNCSWVVYKTNEIGLKSKTPIKIDKNDIVIICDVKNKYVIELSNIISINSFSEYDNIHHTSINFIGKIKTFEIADIQPFIRKTKINVLIE